MLREDLASHPSSWLIISLIKKFRQQSDRQQQPFAGAEDWLDSWQQLQGRMEHQVLLHLQRQIHDRLLQERHQAEEKLQHSLEFIHSVVNAIHDPVFVKDEHHRWVLLNDAFCDFIGCDREVLLDRSDYDFFPQKQADHFWQQDELVLTTGDPHLSEASLIDSRGQAKIVSIKKTCFQDAAGQRFLVSTLRDITELKQTQNALEDANSALEAQVARRTQQLQDLVAELQQQVNDRTQAEITARQNERAYRALLSAIPDLIIRMTLDGTCLDFIYSEQVTPFAGLVDLIGQSVWEILPPDLCQLRLHHMKKAIETGQPQVYEQHIQIDGQLCTEEVRIAMSGENEVLAIIRDITTRKQTERKLQLMQFSLDHAADPILWIKPNARFFYANHAACQSLGYSLAEFFELSVFDIDLEFPPELWTERWQATRQKKSFTLESQHRSKDGRIFPVEITINYIEFDGDEYNFVRVKDITKRKQAELELKQKAIDLEQTLSRLQKTQAQLIQNEKMSSLGQLVAGIAHEINNPISFIYGNLNYVQEYYQDLLRLIDCYQLHYATPVAPIMAELDRVDLDYLRRDIPKLMTSLHMGAERIRQIILSLRTFSRLDEAEIKTVDLHTGIDSALMILAHRLKVQSHRDAIEVDKFYGDLPLLECYAGQLNQVFLNLLTNAIDALDAQAHADPTATLILQIHTEYQQNSIVIRMIDSGIGIPADVRPRIFDPFFTTKPIGQGTGMGLSVCHQIITQQHEGSIECTMTAQGMTEFRIQLPL